MRTSDGLDLQYKVIGRGPPIIFSHEFGGSHASWERPVDRMAAAHQCIIYTARGFAPSTISNEAVHYGGQRLVDDLIELADHLALVRFHLVGAGMGAVTTLLAASPLGDRVRTITLIGCMAGPLSQMDLFEHHSAIRQMLRVLEEKPPTKVSAVMGRQRPYERLMKERVASWHEYRRKIDEHDPVGLALTLKHVEWEPPDLEAMEYRLKQIEAPVQLLLGEGDHPAAHSTAKLLSRQLPFARLVKLVNCGKLAHIEQPSVVSKLLWQHVRNFELAENGQRHYSRLELSMNVEIA